MHDTQVKPRELLLTYLAPQRGRVVTLALLLLALTALQLWSPQLLRQFIDTATNTSAPQRSLLALAGLFLLAALLTQVVQVGATYLSELVSWTATNRLRSVLARHCLRLDRAFHNQRTPGEMIERIDGDVTTLAMFFAQMVLQVIGSILLLVGVLAALFWESTLMGGALSLFAVAVLIALVRIRSIAVKPLVRDREARAAMFGQIEERLAGLDDVRANGSGDYAIRRVDDASRSWLWISMRAQALALWVPTTAMGMFALGYALSLGIGAYLYLQGSATIGTVFLFFQYTDLLRRPIEQLAEQLKQFQAAAAGISRVGELLALRSNIPDGPGRTLASGALKVEFRAAGFAYEQASTIDDLSFTLQPGRVLGVLGRTGSGKTTLTRLLFRLHDVQRGAILLGDTDIRDLTLAQLRGRIGIVTQDVQIWSASLRDNLTLFDATIPDERLRAVLHDIGLGAWVQGLPDGLEPRTGRGRGLRVGGTGAANRLRPRVSARPRSGDS